MSTRPQIKPYQVIPNAAASPANSSSMGASITSAPTILSNLSMLSYQYVWSAGSSPVGAISLQFSNDYSVDAQGNTLNAGTWTTATFLSAGSAVTSVAVSGNSGNGVIDVDATGVWAARTVYTRTSGTGTLVVTLNAKVS